MSTVGSSSTASTVASTAACSDIRPVKQCDAHRCGTPVTSVAGCEAGRCHSSPSGFGSPPSLMSTRVKRHSGSEASPTRSPEQSLARTSRPSRFGVALPAPESGSSPAWWRSAVAAMAAAAAAT
eukprot:scaffold38602_cov69-Phaeocystis_antarctica.AAC.2